ncbi:MAG: tol-pal system protein YbgF [Alphaproteobacteria bacterium 33-17]|nr:MAG: tol-pal system protein YbgF [Alphaproteobacteria bacterium 33-17]
MKKIFLAFTIFAFSNTSFAADYSSQVNAQLIDRIDRMERDVSIMQKQFYRTGDAAPSKFSGGTTGIAGNQVAEMESRLSMIEEQLRDLNGRIEEAQFVSKQLLDKVEMLSKDTDFRFKQLEKGGVKPVDLNHSDGSALDPKSDINAEHMDLSGNDEEAFANQKGETQYAKGKPLNEQVNKSAKPGEQKGDIKSTELDEPSDKKAMEDAEKRKSYDNIIDMIKKSDLDKAQLELGNFITKYKDDPLVGNAYYWLGEVHSAKKQYEKAAINYLKGYKQFSKGKRAPDSLLKLSIALGKLNKAQEACSTLDKLKDRFPDMNPDIRKKSEKEYKQLGCKK